MNRPLTVLYVGMRFDYGDPTRGDCYEYVNLVDSMRHMQDVRLVEFYFDVRLRELGRTGMNEELLRTVRSAKPDVCFFVLYTDEIARETLTHIRRSGIALTVNWFGDDHWRFLPYSRHWAPSFDWVITTDSASVSRYHAIGCERVIKSQWGFNHHLIANLGLEEVHDVTFIGQGHGRRKRLIHSLANHDIRVECWGYGWGNGRLSFEDMISTYARSRINLNFTDSSIVGGWKRIAKVVLNRRSDDTVHWNSPSIMADFVRALFTGHSSQIKGRNFEVPGAGGFLLTSGADNLEEYFVLGEEIVVFHSLADLEEKIRHFLFKPDERLRIRQAGSQRAHRDHTYERRLRDVFSAMGCMEQRRPPDAG